MCSKPVAVSFLSFPKAGTGSQMGKNSENPDLVCENNGVNSG